MMIVYRNKDTGFTLIEIMVSLVIGLVILAGVIAVGGGTLRANNSNLKSVRLNQEMDNAIKTMANELRRAGFSTGDNSLSINFGLAEDINVVSSSCVLYSYNRDGDNIVDNDERNGFKIENNQIKVRRSCDPSGSFSCNTDCANHSDVVWENLMDDDTNKVIATVDTDGDGSALSFTTFGSKARNVDRNTYWYLTSTTTVDFPYAEVSAGNLGGITLCEDLNNNEEIDPVTECSTATSDDAPFWNNGNLIIETRQININLDGALDYDRSVTKELETSVKLGNELVVVIPIP